MFFDILKRDLKRKKTMNIIILLFVILSVMFVSSSVTNLTAVTGSLDSFMDKAGVGDYAVFEKNGGSVTVADAVKDVEGVTEFRQEECIFLSGHKFIGRKTAQDTQNAANTSLASCLSHQIEKYYDGSDNEITEVADGEVYVRRSLLDNSNAKVGDKVELTVSNVTRKPEDITLISRLLATLPHPIGIYFISEDIFTLASYYQEDLRDKGFFPSGWALLPDDSSEALLDCERFPEKPFANDIEGGVLDE